MPVLGMAVFGGACAFAGATLGVLFVYDENKRLKEDLRRRNAQIRQMATSAMKRVQT